MLHSERTPGSLQAVCVLGRVYFFEMIYYLGVEQGFEVTPKLHRALCPRCSARTLARVPFGCTDPSPTRDPPKPKLSGHLARVRKDGTRVR
jgi:hypothetical protein